MGLRTLFGRAAQPPQDMMDPPLNRIGLTSLVAPERPLSAKVLEYECRIRNLLIERYLFEDYFKPIANEFYAMAWGFPASDGAHHPGRLGLIEHSLGVVVGMLKLAPIIREQAVGRFWDAFALHCVLAGLGHDLGKTQEWMVDSRGYDYHPVSGSVRDQGFAVVSYCSSGCHEKLSTVLLPRLLTASGYFSSKMHTPKQLGFVLDAIWRHHENLAQEGLDPNPYVQLLQVADREDAAEDMIVVPTDAELSEREAEIIRDREVVRAKQVEIGIKAIRLALAEARYGYSWYLSQNGWLLVVTPAFTIDEGRGVYHEYQRLLGRSLPAYMLWALLKDAGVMLPFTDQAGDFVRLQLLEQNGRRKTPLSFAVFDESVVFPDPQEIENYERYEIVHLSKIIANTLKGGRNVNKTRLQHNNAVGDVPLAGNEVQADAGTASGNPEGAGDPVKAEN